MKTINILLNLIIAAIILFCTIYLNIILSTYVDFIFKGSLFIFGVIEGIILINFYFENRNSKYNPIIKNRYLYIILGAFVIYNIYFSYSYYTSMKENNKNYENQKP